MPSTRLGSDKYKPLSNWFDSTKIRTREVRIPRSSSTGDECSINSVTPSGYDMYDVYGIYYMYDMYDMHDTWDMCEMYRM